MPYIEVLDQRIVQGDCLEVLAGCADGSVDMVFADLPYGVTANKWDTPIDLPALWRQLLRVAKRNAAFVFTATQPFATTLINSQPNLFRYDLVWLKNAPSGHMMAKKRPMLQHETLIIFGGDTYNPQKTPHSNPRKSRRVDTGKATSANYVTVPQEGTRESPTERYPISFQAFGRVYQKHMVHPTQKPVALLEWLIRTYSNPGDTILDPTCGSGTTLVACQRTGRRGRGIELDRGYVDTAVRRLNDEFRQMPLLGVAGRRA